MSDSRTCQRGQNISLRYLFLWAEKLEPGRFGIKAVVIEKILLEEMKMERFVSGSFFFFFFGFLFLDNRMFGPICTLS